jgi:hypothetical protein
MPEVIALKERRQSLGHEIPILPPILRVDNGARLDFGNCRSACNCEERLRTDTVPGNGDINPYGVAVVPQTIGNLTQGDILVSNFNKSSNVQGTGSTIVQITPAGGVSLFAQISLGIRQNCPGGVGLTTALAVLERGWVIVGSLLTSNGMSATAQAGCLIVLDSMGKPVETFSGSPINGPWDMTALDQGTRASLFVTNMLNGGVATANPPHVVNKGMVVRIEISVPKAGEGMPMIHSTQIIGSGSPR